MTSRNRKPRRAGNPQPLYALLDDRAQNDAQSPAPSRWHRGCSAAAEEAGAKHRAAWRRNVTARNQKIYSGF